MTTITLPNISVGNIFVRSKRALWNDDFTYCCKARGSVSISNSFSIALEVLADESIVIHENPTREVLFNALQALGDNTLYGLKFFPSESIEMDCFVESFKRMNSLRRLTIGECGLTGHGLSVLKGLVGLRSLSVGASRLSDDDLLLTSAYPKMRSMEVSYNQIGDKGLSYLLNMSELRSLEACGLVISAEGIRYLSGLPNLSELSIADCSLSTNSMSAVGSIAGLNYLDVTGNAIGTNGIELLAHSRQLISLEAHSCQVNEEFEHWSKFRHLKHLGISCNIIRDSDIVDISRCPALVSLDVGGSLISNRGLAEIARHMKQLQALKIGDNPIDDDGIREISCLDKLRSLYLSGPSITDASVPHLLCLKSLRSLHVNGTEITSDGADTLSSGLKLEYLDVRDTFRQPPCLFWSPRELFRNNT